MTRWTLLRSSTASDARKPNVSKAKDTSIGFWNAKGQPSFSGLIWPKTTHAHP